MSEKQFTYFLPAERLDTSAVLEMAQAFEKTEGPFFLDRYPIFTAVLNQFRQIVYVNCAALELLGANSTAQTIGKRPGEAIGCVHSAETEGGCGTSRACAFCGAAHGISKGIAGFQTAEECNILRSRDGMATKATFEEASGEFKAFTDALDLLITTKPLPIGGMDLILFFANDISAQKRREALERVFYHDIANTASGIRGILDMIQFSPEAPNPEYVRHLKAAADRLLEEIVSQRSLKEAEEGTLAVQSEKTRALDLLAEAAASFDYYREGRGIELAIEDSDAPSVATDPILLRRVLVNMIKNALEASTRGDRVSLRLRVEGERAIFAVRNPAVMSFETRTRIFHRFYSTKGKGRGVGTYSMRLLGEGYLGGTIRFDSVEGEGTTFEFSLPLTKALD